jgi:hypothetical protein
MAKREIAVIDYRSGYAGLVDAFRTRAQERKIAITSSNVAAMANLPEYYVAKLLSVNPVRRIGMISLGPLLGVLGMKLVAMPDEDAIARYSGKLPQRVAHCAHDGVAIRLTFSRRHMQKIGLKGAEVRWSRARRRSAVAQKGGKARWAKAREGNGKAE